MGETPRILGRKENERTPKVSTATLQAPNCTYHILRENAGGHGKVYICRAVHDISGEYPDLVALKTFDEKYYFSSRVNTQFRQEVQVWSSISSLPFVFPLLDVETIDDRPHIVMFAAGRKKSGDWPCSVGDLIRQNTQGLPPSEIYRIAYGSAVGYSLCERSEPTFVHGDLKPDNILFLGNFPALADFGVSRIINAALPGDWAPGTLHYLAPECWQGGFTTKQSDVYAFGCTLFELLTGHPPFWDATDPSVLRQHHLNDEADIVDSNIVSQFALDLHKICYDCLQKNPKHRPESVGSLAPRLESVGDRHEPATKEDIQRFKAIRLTLPAVLPQLFDELAPRVWSLLKIGDHQQALKLLERVTDNHNSAELLFLKGRTLMLADQEEEALLYLKKCLAAQPNKKIYRQCLEEIGFAYRRMKKFDDAESIFFYLLREAPKKERAHTLSNIGAGLLEQAKYDEAVGLLRNSIAQHAGEPDVWALWRILAEALNETGEHSQAIIAIQRAIGLQPSNPELKVELAIIAMDGLGNLVMAREALELATGQGYLDFTSMVRLLVVNDLMNSHERCAGIVLMIKEKASTEELDTIFKEVKRVGKRFMKKWPLGSAREHMQTNSRDDNESNNLPYANDKRTVQSEFIITNAETPDHIVMPFMTVRSEFDVRTTIDFYDESMDPGYSEHFGDCFRMLVQSDYWIAGTRKLRSELFKLVSCVHCSQIILTNRSMDERLFCRACDKETPLVLNVNNESKSIITACEAAIDLPRKPMHDKAVLVGMWPRNPSQSSSIREAAEKQGWMICDSASVAHQQVASIGMESNMLPVQDLIVWAVSAQPGAEGYENVPSHLDDVVAKIRERFGGCDAVTLGVPSTVFDSMLKTQEQGLDDEIARLRNDTPTSNGYRMLLEFLIRKGETDEAQELLAIMLLTWPEHPDTLIAEGVLLAHEESWDESVLKLEAAIQLVPRDRMAAYHMMMAYHGAGRIDDANKVFHRLKVLGSPKIFYDN